MNWSEYFYIDATRYNALRWKRASGRRRASVLVNLHKRVTIEGARYDPQDVWYELKYGVCLLKNRPSLRCEEKDIYNQEDKNANVYVPGVSYKKSNNSFVARWYEDGKQLQRSFSCNKYDDAYERAVAQREKQDSYSFWC